MHLASIRGLIALATALSVLGVMSCESSNEPGGQQEAGTADGSSSADGSGPKVGEVCVNGGCATGVICLAAVCHTMCTGGCGEKVAACGPDEACRWASDFTGACVKGTAKVGEKCGDGIQCLPGALCGGVEGGPQTCYALANPDCPPGQQKGTVRSNGCTVCR